MQGFEEETVMRLTKTMLLAATAAVALTTAARAQDAVPYKPSADTSGTITVWTWPNNDRTFQALMPAFNEAYPNIKVEVQGFPNADNQYLNTVQRALLSGSGPDVAMIEIGVLALLRERPQWVDLSQDPYSADELMSQFAPAAAANVTLADGKIVALPKHTGPGGFFYRRDIFEEAGLATDPVEVQAQFADWNAFIEEGKKVVKPNERWLVANGMEIVSTMMAQRGVSWFDADGNLQLDNPIVLEALQVVDKAADAGLISPFTMWSPEWQGAFGRGQIATIMSGNWFGGLLKRAFAPDDAGKWGVAAAPADSTGNRSFNAGGDHIGILETSQNKEAAWAFISWVVTDGVSLQQQYQNDDLYPAWSPAGKTDWINFEDPYYAGENVNSVFADVQANLIPSTLNKSDNIVGAAMETAVNNIVQGVATPEEALAQAKTEVAARL
jgi:ABC-type glycerol-3-phosphate transport system substrate-binding protein